MKLDNHSNPMTVTEGQEKQKDIIVSGCVSRTAIIKGNNDVTDVNITLDHTNSFDEQLQAICNVLWKIYEEGGEKDE